MNQQKNTDKAATLRQMADGLVAARRLDLATVLLEQALELEPDSPQLLAALARAMERTNRCEEALEIVARGLAAAPGYPWLVIERARILNRLGEPEKARRCLAPASAWSDKAAITASFLSGKICDRLGDHDRAYHHFQHGNRLQIQRNPTLDPEQYARYYISPFENRLAQLVPILSMPLPACHHPVFLVGFPRSGTTLLDLILDRHPGIVCVEEANTLNEIRKRISYHSHMAFDRLVDLSAKQIARLRENYFSEVRAAVSWRGDTVLIDKLPLNLVHIPLILRLFPQARFLFCLRHPYDVCLSCFCTNFNPKLPTVHFSSLTRTAAFYHRVMGYGLRLGKILQPRVHTIRYERLVTDFNNEIRDTLQFLELEWSPHLETFYRHPRIHRGVNTPSYDQVTRPLNHSAIGRWRAYAKRFDAGIREMLHPYLARFGYGE